MSVHGFDERMIDVHYYYYIDLIAVCGTLIISVILHRDKQKQICDHKFSTVL